MIGKKYGILIGLLGVTAVSFGAFGAHGLKDLLAPDKLQTYNTGITYHFYHLFAICIATLLYNRTKGKYSRRAIWIFLFGIIMFSGSLYLLACREVLGIENYKWIGPITPIGGVLFIVGWVFLGIEFCRFNSLENNS